MKNYELTVVLDGRATAAKKKAVVSKIEKLIVALNGKVGSIQDWGEKVLSYKIKKSTSGVFLHFSVELGSGAARSLASKLNVEQDIIRFLFVRK
jgi:ribosomal protein S6